jgi:hypothetical protein
LSTARPGDLNRLVGFDARGVNSGLVIPYPGVMDQGKAFYRIRLYAPFKRSDGKEQRYAQPTGSGVHLYLPPGMRERLGDPSLPLAFVEGEKKALSGVQAGLSYVGLGGLWNFLQDGKPIPDLEMIARGRRVIELVPDSDVWARPDLLQTVYAFDRLWESRGLKSLWWS